MSIPVNNQISEPGRVLLSLVGCTLFGTDLCLSETVSPGQVLSESRHQAVTRAAYESLPENWRVLWEKPALSSLKTTMVVNAWHGEIHRLMIENGIPYCILKGCSSAYYYPDPLCRAMGDVDFLVDKKDVAQATEILKSAGYIPWDEEHICHIVFRKGQRHVEMHFEPAGIPDGRAGEIIRGYLSDIFLSSTDAAVKSVSFVKPDHFHHGLILLMHTYHHLLSEGIGLRHLCDFAVFADHFTDEQFREIFEEKLRAAGLWKFTEILGMTAHEALGLPFRGWMDAGDGKVCSELLADIFCGGNFGVKDYERVTQGIMISNRGKDGVSRSKFVQIIKGLVKVSYVKYPVTQKAKLLLPFGMTAVGTGLLLKVLSGRRTMPRLRHAAKKAEIRKKLYRKLHLFEITTEEL